jgi:hypothetical protein
MLVSVSSFLPIIIVGPISDLIGTATVMLVVAIAVIVAGVASVLRRGSTPESAAVTADPHAEDPIAAALGADRPKWRTEASQPAPAPPPPWAPPGPADPADRD